MPTLTRWFLRSSLLFFLLAMLLGVLHAARAPLNLPAQLNAFSPIYFHLFMVGWVTQLIFGVVFWMFPKYSKEQPRGSETPGLGHLLAAQPRAAAPPGGRAGPGAAHRSCSGAGLWRPPPSCNGLLACSLLSTPGAGSRSADMPRLSVWFIRLSLIYLALGFTFGGLLLLNKGLPLVR